MLATMPAGAGSCLGLLAAPRALDRAQSNPVDRRRHGLERVADAYARCAPKRDGDLGVGRDTAVALKWWIGADMRYAGQGHNAR